MVPVWLAWGLTAFVAVLGLYVLWAHRAWARRGVPHVQPQFLLGSTWELLTRSRTAGQVFGDMYRRFDKEPFVGFYKMLTPVLLVRDPDLVQEILVKNFSSFQNNEAVFPEGKDEVFSNNPFVAEFERWKGLRTKMSQMFTPVRVRLAFEDIAVSGQRLADYLLAAEEGVSLDGNNLVKRYTAHTSVRVLFGLEANTLEVGYKLSNAEFGKDPGPFYDMGHAIFNDQRLIVTLRFIAFFTCPALLRVLGYEFVNQQTLSFFRKLIRDSIEFRHKEGCTRDDFIDHASKLVLVDGKVDEAALRAVVSQAINSYVETFETASTVIATTLLLLAVHSEEQDRLRAELRAAFPDKKLTSHDALVALPYLDRVIKESMRMFTPADTVRRACTKATTLQAGGRSLSLQPGDVVYVPVQAMHEDPAFFSRADQFYPDHFTEEESAGRPKCAYLPFSDGPRMCPGYRFGTLQIKVALASVLLHVEVAPGPEQVLPPQRDPAGKVMDILGGLWLRVRRV